MEEEMQINCLQKIVNYRKNIDKIYCMLLDLSVNINISNVDDINQRLVDLITYIEQVR